MRYKLDGARLKVVADAHHITPRLQSEITDFANPFTRCVFCIEPARV